MRKSNTLCMAIVMMALFLANSFKHKLINKYTQEKRIKKNSTDHKHVDIELKPDELNAKDVSDIFKGSSHCTVVEKNG